jgi:porin
LRRRSPATLKFMQPLWLWAFTHSFFAACNRDPYNQDTTGFGLAIRNTPVFVYEAAYLVDVNRREAERPSSAPSRKIYPGSYKFGAAYNGGKFLNPVTNHLFNGNYLIYFMADQAVYRPFAASNRGLDLSFGLDWSPTDLNRENERITEDCAITASSLIGNKIAGHLASYTAKSAISSASQRTLVGGPSLGSEKAIELNYAIQASHGIQLQPVFQYYIDVGANSHIPNAAVLGFRTKVTF